MPKITKSLLGIAAACLIASGAYGQSASVSINNLPTRSLSYVIGHDNNGLAGRQAIGSMAFQNSGAVSITGGAISGLSNDLAITDGGTGSSTASGARTNLGLGTAATQNTGTSGGNVPLLNGANTWGANQIIGGFISPNLTLNGSTTGSSNVIAGQKTSLTRWAIIPGNGTAEGGSNTGSDFQITRYNDAGTGVDNPVTISRSTGIMTLVQPLPVGSGGTGGATQSTARSGIGAAASGANSDITSISGLTTALSIAQGGTGGTSQATAQSALGLGSMATQAASAVAITGGTINGTTVGAATASTGRFTTLSATSTITPSSTSGIVGTTTNDNANAGSIGEFVSNSVSSATATNNAVTAATSVSLTAGDWDVSGQVQFTLSAANSNLQAGIDTSQAASSVQKWTINTASSNSGASVTTPVVRMSLSSTTTVYLNYFSAANATTVNGFIRARRIR